MFIIPCIYYCLPLFLCNLYTYCVFLALVEPSYALLPTTCNPKAVGGVCHTTNYQSHSQQSVTLLIIQCVHPSIYNGNQSQQSLQWTHLGGHQS